MKMNKNALYEQIMNQVAKTVKKSLNEYMDVEDEYTEEETDEQHTVFCPNFGTCTIKYCFEAGDKGDYYEVYDEDDNFICELPYDIDFDDEDDLIDRINDASEYEYEMEENDDEWDVDVDDAQWSGDDEVVEWDEEDEEF